MATKNSQKHLPPQTTGGRSCRPRRRGPSLIKISFGRYLIWCLFWCLCLAMGLILYSLNRPSSVPLSAMRLILHCPNRAGLVPVFGHGTHFALFKSAQVSASFGNGDHFVLPKSGCLLPALAMVLTMGLILYPPSPPGAVFRTIQVSPMR